MKKISIFIVLSFLCFSLFAQNKLTILYSSAGMEYGKANAVDLDTNYINAALFQNTINTSPTGTVNLTAPSLNTQVALTKYSRHGKLLQAKHFGGVTTSEAPHGIECDAQKNIYVTGYFGNTTLTGTQNADFNPAGGGTITSQGNEDCFVAKYDKDGNYLWAFGLGNQGAETEERCWDLSVSPNGDFYVGGAFNGTVNFNPLGTTLTQTLPNGTIGLFIAKYNTNGICQWVVPIAAGCNSVFNEAYTTFDLDNNENLFLAGNFRAANVNFNPHGTSTTLSSNGNCDIFLAKYNTCNHYKQQEFVAQKLLHLSV